MTDAPDWADEEAAMLLFNHDESEVKHDDVASALRAAFLRGRVAELREAAITVGAWPTVSYGSFDERLKVQGATVDMASALRAAADKLEKGEA